ncbi:MAG: sporulation protein YqfD [Clostridiales bacterium]|nr:sporulation protein YqfD [Clostridiales bacterium]
MRQSVLHRLGGYVRVKLGGYEPERFFNLCRARGLEIWEISEREHEYYFYMALRDFRQVRPPARKAHVRLRVTGKYGFPFFIRNNRHRTPYLAGIVLFFLVLLMMSRYIWDIRFSGNLRFTDDALLHYLQGRGVVYGMKVREVDCDSLEEAIRGDFPEITWVSARVSGTRLLIKIKENETAGEAMGEGDSDKNEAPRDLVTEKDGIITHLIVRSGRALVRSGDEVEAGDVLVTGVLPLYDDSEALMATHYVRADADIYARTEETCSSVVPLLTAERTDTGDVRHGLRLRVAGLQFLWMLPSNGENCWEVECESRQVTVLGDFYLPLWVDRLTLREYRLYERQRRPEELTLLKEKILEENRKNFLEKGLSIIQNDATIQKDGLRYRVTCRFLLEGPIGTGREITESEENNLADERSRDDD